MKENQHDSIEALKDIKRMMEKSSRFVSLSGLSGIAAGICALVASFFAGQVINKSLGVSQLRFQDNINYGAVTLHDFMGSQLLHIAIITLVVTLCLAFLFTYLRSKKHNIPLWGTTAKRLLINLAIPLIAGGVYLLQLIKQGSFGLIAPGCLLFYGLALVNASKYTLGEIRYLGYCQIMLAIINCFFVGYGLYFWAIGFGVLHIAYGFYMWNKYERA